MISVPTKRPPIITTAADPNRESLNSGIIPKIVVKDASTTGRKRITELSNNAEAGFLPSEICNVISSIRTMAFLINIPTKPSTATIATNPNTLPEINIPAVTPMKIKGKHRMMISGFYNP